MATPSQSVATAIDPERTRRILRQVRRLEIQSRRLVSSPLAGAYHSAFRGQGLDFEEVRAYQPGDDVRSIDWNVTALMDRPFVKVFREDRELTLMLVLDISRSGGLGIGREQKREAAAEAAAILAFTAARNQDRVGLVCFSDRVEKIVPPARGQQHLLRLTREALFRQPEGRGTALAPVLHQLQGLMRHRGVVVVISDWQTPELRKPESRALLERRLRQTHQRHDLITIRVHHPAEQRLPRCGWLRGTDPETGETVLIDTNRRKVREAFDRAADFQAQQRHQLFRSSGVDTLEVEAGQDFGPLLHQFFARRAGMTF